MAPELVEAFMTEYQEEVNRLRRETDAARKAEEQELVRVTEKIAGGYGTCLTASRGFALMGPILVVVFYWASAPPVLRPKSIYVRGKAMPMIKIRTRESFD